MKKRSLIFLITGEKKCSMKKILIVGGGGFIGSHLTEHFLRKENHVWILDNFLTSHQDNILRLKQYASFHCVKADLLDLNLHNILHATAFDIIYHLASPASPIQYMRYPIETLRVNSEGTYKLLEFCRASSSGCFVYASTSEIYGDPLIHPQKENYWGNVNPVGERAPYDEAKRFGEALCMTYIKKYHMDIRIARVFNTYGPYMQEQDGRAISNFITMALREKPITVTGDGRQTRSFCYVSDLVNALSFLGEKKVAGEIINLGNPEEKKIIAIAQMIKQFTNSPSPIVYSSQRIDDPKKRKPDIAKAKKLLGWQPEISLQEGLQSTISYFKGKLQR